MSQYLEFFGIAAEDKTIVDRNCCKVICGAPTTSDMRSSPLAGSFENKHFFQAIFGEIKVDNSTSKQHHMESHKCCFIIRPL